jgi:hypothetical protein
MKIKVHNFNVGGGNVVTNGKSHWPDCLNVILPKNRILSLMETLINSMQYNDKNKDTVSLNFMGKLEYDIDEESIGPNPDTRRKNNGMGKV